MGARNLKLRTLGSFGATRNTLHNTDKVNLEVLTFAVYLSLDLFGESKKKSLIFVFSLDRKDNGAGAAVDLIDLGVQNFLFTGSKLAVNSAAFGFANTLNDNLLCGLGCDSGERLGFKANLNNVSESAF